MINDLEETLRTLLVQKGGINLAQVDISFEMPSREWSAGITRPTINFYLYDVRENVQLREHAWDELPAEDSGRVLLKRRPVRLNLAYMVSCWTTATEDQNRLLWRVLETLFRNSPLPDEVLQGDLRNLLYEVPTEVAQPETIMKNVTDFWGGLDNELRPGIHLVITLELGLNQIENAPLVFTKVVKLGLGERKTNGLGREVQLERLAPGWEVGPVQLGGRVSDSQGQPMVGVSVRLVGNRPDERPGQFGPTLQTDAVGRYIFEMVPPGDYTLVVEPPGQEPRQYPLNIQVNERGVALPQLLPEVVIDNQPDQKS